MIVGSQDIKKLGKILGVWAHPDDETYCSGGLIAAAVANGQTVICVTATMGEKGVQDESRWPAKDLANIRTRELAAAYKVLGVKRHECLEIADGECDEVDHGQDDILAAIVTYKPDTILTFGPDGLTGHSDHQAVSAWALWAGKICDVPVYQFVMPEPSYKAYRDVCAHAKAQGKHVDDMFFNIDTPALGVKDSCDIYLELSNELWQKKLGALKCMPSQTERLIKQLGEENYQKIFSREAFVLAK